MYFTLPLVSSLLLAGGAVAQYGNGGGSGMSSSMMPDMAMSSAMPEAASPSKAMAASSAMTDAAAPSGMGSMVNMHIVKVSNKNGDLMFAPNNLQAQVGEMVQFQFYPNNHSIVQAAFDTPCMPMNNGLFSGYMPVKATDTMMPAYTIKINDTNPIWYYCSKDTHCQQGMVGVINAPATNKSRTIESFAASAKNAQSNTAPMEGTTGGMAGTSGNASTTMMTMGANTTMMGMPSATGAGMQAKSGAYSSRQDVLSGVGLATVVGLVVAFVS